MHNRKKLYVVHPHRNHVINNHLTVVGPKDFCPPGPKPLLVTHIHVRKQDAKLPGKFVEKRTLKKALFP